MFCPHLFTTYHFHRKPEYKENDKLSRIRYKSRTVSLGLGVNRAETDGFSSSEGESDIFLLYKTYTIRIRCPVRHYGQKGCLHGKNRNEMLAEL